MGILDALNKFAKEVGDQANDAFEVSKLNSKLNAEKAVVKNLKEEIGQMVYEKYKAGETLAEFSEQLLALDQKNTSITELEEKIKEIKRLEDSAKQIVETEVKAKFCPECGAKLENDSKFCGECGTAIR